MYDYDCIVMQDSGGWSCMSNSIINESINVAEDDDLARDGYFFRDLSATEVHIIVNRLDTNAAQLGSTAFYATH